MHVVVIGPYHAAYLYFTAAKDMGMTVSAITTNRDDYAVPESIQKELDHFIVVSAFDVDTLVGAVSRLHQKEPLQGIVPGVEFLVEQTAQVAKVLELPSIDPTNAAAVRNKAVMRKRLHEAGVRAPRFATALSAVDLEQVAKTVGFPAVIKPLEMAGSVGVARVNDAVELLAAYEDIANDHEGNWNLVPGSEVLVEELLVGTEFCVDGYVANDGEVTIFEFTQVEHGPLPHFQQIGYTSYRHEDLPSADILIDYVKSVVRAVGITIGPFHSQVMLTKDGPVLIEIANRLPGDHIPELNERVTGISFAKCALAVVTGGVVPTPGSPKARLTASQFIIEPSLMGQTYTRLDGWDEIVGNPVVDDVFIEIKPGETIPPHADLRSRIAEVQYHADSLTEIEAFRQKIIKTIRVEA
jgi:biotin carboxylase